MTLFTGPGFSVSRFQPGVPSRATLPTFIPLPPPVSAPFNPITDIEFEPFGEGGPSVGGRGCCDPGQSCSGVCVGGGSAFGITVPSVCVGTCRPTPGVSDPFTGTEIPSGFGPADLPASPAQLPAGTDLKCGECYVPGTSTACRPRGTKGRLKVCGDQTVCVPKPKKMNPANPSAAKRAVRRLSGHQKLLKQTEKALSKLAPARPRASSRRSRSASCSCQ